MTSLLIALVLAAAAPRVEVETLDGRSLVGTLASLDARGLAIETPEGSMPLAANELMQIVVQDPSEASGAAVYVWAELVDGSSVVGTSFATEGKTARFGAGDGRVIEMPTNALATVRLAEASEATAAEWARIVDNRRTSDVLVVHAGDTIDYHRGVLGDVSENTVQFELDGETLPVKRSKVYGLIYYRPQGTSLQETVCRITDTSGARWSVATLELGEELTWTTPSGVKRTQPLSTIRKIDFSGGNIVYLSDLDPESVDVTPYFGGGATLPLLSDFFALRTDTNLRSGPLKLDSKQYRKGLAMHSRTEVVYRLPEKFRRFLAIVGIDDSVRPNGNVRLVISGDDRVLLETTVAGTDASKPIELDVSGIRRLTILADFGEGTDVADHLDLCEARLIK